MTLGFIGLGALGGAIATRLLGAGHQLAIWGRTSTKLTPWLDAGATFAESPAALAGECETVFLCVSDTAAVEQVTFAAEGLVVGARPGTIVVDHSTIHPLATQDFATRLAVQGDLSWIDAPVSGGVVGAEAGKLVMMAGGDGAAIERLRPILACYSQQVTHMGPVGSGQATKLANQMIIGATVAVVAEALNYAANFGVTASQIPDALTGGWADSAVLQNHARRMAAAHYADDVDAAIMAKDIDIACDMGRETGSPMPISATVQQLYRQLIATGNYDKGQIGLMWLYKQEPL